MRNLSPNALAAISQKLGTEPISIIEIQWDGTASWFYSDRNITDSDFSDYIAVPGQNPQLLVAGKVLEIGSLDNVVDLTHHKSSSEINVKLDDTDGTLKLLMNDNDIHLKKVRLWQMFAGMPSFSDKFLVFAGHVASPVVWSEHDRTLSFNAMSKLDDQEVGFSAEAGQFMFLPSALVGKAWPMVFGTVMTYQALRINAALHGILGTGIGICTGDGGLWQQNNQRVILHHPETDYPDTRVAEIQLEFLYQCQFLYADAADYLHGKNPKSASSYQAKADSLGEEIKHLREQIDSQWVEWNRQSLCRQSATSLASGAAACNTNSKLTSQSTQITLGNGPDIVTILGGEDFPQDQVITLNIGGGYFVGVMHGTTFSVSSRFQPLVTESQAAKDAEKYTQHCITISPSSECQSSANQKLVHYHFEMQVPLTSRTGLPGSGAMQSMSNYWVDGYLSPTQHETAHSSELGGGSAETNQGTSGSSFWANAGADVSLASGELIDYTNPNGLYPDWIIKAYRLSSEPMFYVASIVPGTVLEVQAYRADAQLARQLVTIPSNYYTIVDAPYGPITAKMIVLIQPLSTLQELDQLGKVVSQGWEDTVYVTYRSDIGPNIVDIVEYLIQKYTTLTWDAASFNACRLKLEKFPANFPILTQKNIVSLLEEISYQSRCAIWLQDDVFYMKYLAEEPIVDDTITENDVDFDKGIMVEYTTTEDLVTRETCNWHLNWGEKGQYTFILRHNVKKYGIKDDTYDYYMYNQPDIIYKVATFWMIRKSNTWKRIKFSTFLNKLNLETFDTVLLDFGSRTYAAYGPIKAIVEKASYNSDSNTIDFECLIPVKSGQMTQYPFFWPASLPAGTSFPTQEEINEGWAGGNSIGQSAYGILPVGYTPNQGGSIIIGGINIGYGPNSDWGDRTPSDIGFSAKAVVDNTAYQNMSGASAPRPYLDLPAIPPTNVMLPGYSPFVLPPISPGIIGIDIHNTPILDGEKGTVATLDTFFKEVSSDGYLLGDTKAYWADDAHDDTAAQQFDFKFDDEGGMWGAGTAFLKAD